MKQEEFEKCEREKEKAKRKDIQEIKENLWRKWRTKKLSRKENIEKSKNKNKDENTRKIELENKLKEIEEAIAKVKSEQAEEKKKKDAKMAKLEKKRKLEKHWEMLKWITEYIDKSTPIWQEQDRRTEKEHPEDWSRISRQEKIDIIIEKEKKELTREEKIIIAKEKKSYWTEWRGKGKEHPVPSPKQRSDEVSPDTPTKVTGGLRGGGRNPLKEDAGAPPTTPNITITSGIIGDMKNGSAIIRYSHCAERVRRHFQENVYRSYEKSMRLGTIEEEKTPFSNNSWARGGGRETAKDDSAAPPTPGDRPMVRSDIPPHCKMPLDLEKIMIYDEKKHNFEIDILEDWLKVCDSRTIALSAVDTMLNKMFEDVTLHNIHPTAPPSLPPKPIPPKSEKKKDFQSIDPLKNRTRKNPPDANHHKFSRTATIKKWLESKKQENGTFNLTKCTKFSEPTISTNKKRRKLTNLQKKANIQKENFKKFFTQPAPESTHPPPTRQNLQTQATSQKHDSDLQNDFETRKRKIIHDNCEKFTPKKKTGTVGNLLKMFEEKQPQKRI